MSFVATLRERFASKLSRNVGSTLVAQGVSWIAALVLALYLPGYFGVEGMGNFTLAAAIAGMLTVLVNFGTSTVLVREIARHPERTTDLVRTALLMRLWLSIAIILLGAAATYLIDYDGYDENVRLLIIISVAAGCTGQIGDVFASALRGREEFPKQNAAALAEKLLVSGASIALVFLHAPLWAFAAVYIAGGAVSGTLCWRWLHTLPAIRAEDSKTGTAQRSDVRALAVAGMPFVAAMLFVSIYGDGSSALLLSKLSTQEAMGCFGFAKRIVGAAHVVPVAIAGALLPILSRLHTENKNDEFARTVRRMTAGMVLCALPFAVLLIGAPQWILQLLHYPDGFVKALPVLRLSGGVMVLWFLQQAIGTALIACDRQVVFGRATGIAALLAFPVCGVCIWAGERFFRDGAVGALVGDALLEAFLLTSYTLALPPGTLFKRTAPDGMSSDTVPKVAA